MSPERMDSPAGGPEEEHGFEIANEFARVWVRKRYTRNGVRLEICSPRLDSGVLLDAVLLESLTWQSDETLARFLATPFQATEPSIDRRDEEAR